MPLRAAPHAIHASRRRPDGADGFDHRPQHRIGRGRRRVREAAAGHALARAHRRDHRPRGRHGAPPPRGRGPRALRPDRAPPRRALPARRRGSERRGLAARGGRGARGGGTRSPLHARDGGDRERDQRRPSRSTSTRRAACYRSACSRSCAKTARSRPCSGRTWGPGRTPCLPARSPRIWRRRERHLQAPIADRPPTVCGSPARVEHRGRPRRSAKAHLARVLPRPEGLGPVAPGRRVLPRRRALRAEPHGAHARGDEPADRQGPLPRRQGRASALARLSSC